MRFTAGIIAFSAAIAGVAATGDQIESTTTLTSTTTRTMTVTECDPTVPDCPLRSTTSSTFTTPSSSVVTTTSLNTTTSASSTSTKWSVSHNSTTCAGPTAPITTSIIRGPTTDVPDQPPPTETEPAPSTVPSDGAAGSITAHSGVLAAAAAAAIAAIY